LLSVWSGIVNGTPFKISEAMNSEPSGVSIKIAKEKNNGKRLNQWLLVVGHAPEQRL